MIINFSVQNFGSIKDKQTLSFEADKSTHLEDYYVIQAGNLRLLKLALIYGANASGKTMLLKALDFLRELVMFPPSTKTETLKFKPFLFDTETPKQNTLLFIEFIQEDIHYEYEVELTQTAIVREELYYHNPNRANIFKRTTNPEKQFSEITFGGKIKTDSIFKKTLEANTLWNSTVLGGFLKTNMESPELTSVLKWFSGYMLYLISPEDNLEMSINYQINKNPELKNLVLDILKKADFNISDILDEEDSSGDLQFEHLINNTKYILSLKQESRGTQRYLTLAGILHYLIKLPIVCPVDELESSLHPDLFEHFLITFLMNARSSQLIATTHNREILNNKDLFRNDAIWITDKTEDCATELYSLADFDTSVIRNTSNIYNAYKTGKLGGIPRLGDNYIDNGNENK